MTTKPVREHVLACAQNYAKRAANPVTAWDCLGAKAWAGRCEDLANEVLGMSEEDALAHLIRRRDSGKHLSWSEPNTSPWSFVVTLDLLQHMDTIVDPIAREQRGWIEVSSYGGLDNGKLSSRPSYRRMLGVNHCVSYCGRKLDESDQAWNARRVAWLSQYHPNIYVMSRDGGYGWGLGGGQCTSLLGTIGEFSKIEHPWFNRDTCVACNLPTAERKTQANIGSYATECGPMCGICHREREPHRHPVPDNSEVLA